jgi:hypothetical protein
MNEIQDEYLIFEPKPWTKATISQWNIEEDELTQRRELEETLLEKQKEWRNKALENLKDDQSFYQKLISTKKLESYLWNAVKEATLESLSGILDRHSPEETEEMIEQVLMTPNDDRPFRFGRMEEETQSIYSFQNLMRGQLLPEGNYRAKVTNVTLQTIEDKSDRNYGRKIYIFEAEIAKGQFTGKTAKIPFIANPVYLDFRMAGETEESRRLGIEEYGTRLLKTIRNVGVVITDYESMVAQTMQVIGNTIEFSINARKQASIDKLIERVKSVDGMLQHTELPDGNDAPF